MHVHEERLVAGQANSHPLRSAVLLQSLRVRARCVLKNGLSICDPHEVCVCPSRAEIFVISCTCVRHEMYVDSGMEFSSRKHSTYTYLTDVCRLHRS